MNYTATQQVNLDAIRRMNKAENSGDWNTVYELTTPDCVTYVGSIVLRGQDEMRRYDAQLFPLLASYRRTILGIVAEGDTVAFRWRADAELKADNRYISWEAVSWCRMEEGKVAEGRIYVDSAAVQRQMQGAG
jgi:ketosteroid isomerase-like protein